MNYLKRWAPLVVLFILFFWLMSIKAAGNLDQGDWLTKKNPFSDVADVSAAKPVDDFTELREYLELEGLHYLIKQSHPRSVTIYYDYDEDWQQATRNWTCGKMNAAFPKAQLKGLSIVDINDASRGRTYFVC